MTDEKRPSGLEVESKAKKLNLPANIRPILAAFSSYLHADSKHYPHVWPSLETIAEDTGRTKRHIRTVTGKLIALGYLSVAEGHDRSGGRANPTRYKVDVQRIMAEAEYTLKKRLERRQTQAEKAEISSSFEESERRKSTTAREEQFSAFNTIKEEIHAPKKEQISSEQSKEKQSIFLKTEIEKQQSRPAQEKIFAPVVRNPLPPPPEIASGSERVLLHPNTEKAENRSSLASEQLRVAKYSPSEIKRMQDHLVFYEGFKNPICWQKEHADALRKTLSEIQANTEAGLVTRPTV